MLTHLKNMWMTTESQEQRRRVGVYVRLGLQPGERFIYVVASDMRSLIHYNSRRQR